MRYVFSALPQRIYWEVTRACDLACRHCRAEAQSRRAPGELDTPEAKRVIRQIAEAGEPRPHLIFTGGDPLKRADLLELVAFAVAAGLQVSVSPAVTPLCTGEALRALRQAGTAAVSFSLDGSDAARHDGLRRVPGTFDRTLVAVGEALAAGLLVQVNTLVTAATLPDLPAIDALVTAMGVQRWSLFFLISVGRGRELGQLEPEACEELFAWVHARSRRKGGPIVTTTEAPHYRRFVLEQARASGDPTPTRARNGAERSGGTQEVASVEAHAGHGEHTAHGGPRGAGPHGLGIRDGNGVMFISHRGEIMPSGFLPLVAGNVSASNPIEVYRDSPLFQSLRDPSRFEGKCGVCEYRNVCGGSRARAWAATGSPLGSDPLCPYEPSGRAESAAGAPPSSSVFHLPCARA